MNQLTNGWIIVPYVISGLMLLSLTYRGIGFYMSGSKSVGSRAEYIGLLLLLPAMACSMAINLWLSSVASYLLTGALWGLTFPLRYIVRDALASALPLNWSTLRNWRIWLPTPYLTILHAFLWPLSVPVCYWLVNDAGMVCPGCSE